MRRPIPIAVSVVAVLLLLGSPFLRVNFATPDDRVLPPSASSRQASELLRSELAGNTAESFGVVADGITPDRTADISATASAISTIDGVARVDSAAGTFVDGAVTASGETDARFQIADAT
jgi:putative drug exporter of the RND superfamily